MIVSFGFLIHGAGFEVCFFFLGYILKILQKTLLCSAWNQYPTSTAVHLIISDHQSFALVGLVLGWVTKYSKKTPSCKDFPFFLFVFSSLSKAISEMLINTCVKMPIGFTNVTSSTARTCKLLNNTWFKRIRNKIFKPKHSAKFEQRENKFYDKSLQYLFIMDEIFLPV